MRAKLFFAVEGFPKKITVELVIFSSLVNTDGRLQIATPHEKPVRSAQCRYPLIENRMVILFAFQQ